jgi:hypothetical protein
MNLKAQDQRSLCSVNGERSEQARLCGRHHVGYIGKGGCPPEKVNSTKTERQSSKTGLFCELYNGHWDVAPPVKHLPSANYSAHAEDYSGAVVPFACSSNVPPTIIWMHVYQEALYRLVR